MTNILLVTIAIMSANAQQNAAPAKSTPQLSSAAKITNDSTQKISPAKDRIAAIDSALKSAGDKFSEDDYFFFYSTRSQICSELNIPDCSNHNILTDLACSSSKNIPAALILESHINNLKQEDKLYPLIDAIKKCQTQTVAKKVFLEEILSKAMAEKWKKAARLTSFAALAYLQSSDPQLQTFGFKILQESVDNFGADKPLPLSTLKEINIFASKVLLTIPANAKIHPSWINWLESSVEHFEQAGLLGTYNKLYQRVITTPNIPPQQLVSLIRGTCKHGRIYGQFNDCTNAIKAYKNKLSPSQLAEIQLFLSIAYSEAGNQKGAMEQLSPLLNSLKAEERGLIPWANLAAAFIQMNIPDMAKAKKYLDQHYKLIDYSKSANLDVFNRNYAKITKLSLLRETGDLTQAKAIAAEILNDVSNNISGTPMIKSWVVIEILMAAAQEKNLSEIKKIASDLRTISNDLPDYQYMATIADAFEAAADGRYTDTLLESARNKVGKDNPPLKRVEKVLKNFSAKK